jgi:uncharacterized protein (TIGR02058 family)
MARVRCITEMGMGVDVHGRDATKAARRAVSDAIRHSSVGFFRMVGKTANDMFVDVTIGVPDPGAVDCAAVAKELPYGTVTVTAVKGGLEIPAERGSDAIIIANAAVIVSLDDGVPDSAHHDVDSSGLAFEIASRPAFREALQEGRPVLLEPIMKLEVVTPEDYSGSVIGDLNSRRGQIQGQDIRGNANVIHAMVPRTNMFGYVNSLRQMSQGRATFTMQFDHYAITPFPDDDPPFRPANQNS